MESGVSGAFWPKLKPVDVDLCPNPPNAGWSAGFGSVGFAPSPEVPVAPDPKENGVDALVAG